MDKMMKRSLSIYRIYGNYNNKNKERFVLFLFGGQAQTQGETQSIVFYHCIL